MMGNIDVIQETGSKMKDGIVLLVKLVRIYQLLLQHSGMAAVHTRNVVGLSLIHI